MDLPVIDDDAPVVVTLAEPCAASTSTPTPPVVVITSDELTVTEPVPAVARTPPVVPLMVWLPLASTMTGPMPAPTAEMPRPAWPVTSLPT